jgi:phosphoglycerate dehydrogenase-like enzyme
MKIWKNTSTLNGFDKGLKFTESKKEASLALIGSKKIDLNSFPKLKGIFRAGIGRDNVPEKEARIKGIIISYPSKKTQNIIYEETAHFTCNLIFRMLYSNIGTLDPWGKEPRLQLSQKSLLVIGAGRIGGRIAELMKNFMNVTSYDILKNKKSELKELIEHADCVTLHIPKSKENISFFDREKISWMKNRSSLINTARGAIVDENSLYNELKKNRISAAFDVFWEEPYKGKLSHLNSDQFYMTPHVASTCSGFLQGCREDLNKLMLKLER